MSDTPRTSDSIDDGARDCGAFMLDAIGPFAPSQLSVRWLDNPSEQSKQVRKIIQDAWAHRTAEARQNGIQLWNGPLCRLIDYSTDGHCLEITLGPTDYQSFLGTNLHNAYLRHLYGPEALANPLGVSTNLIVGDQYLILGRRSSSVGYHAKRIHPVGGCVQTASQSGPPNLLSSLKLELREELGLADGQIGDIVCLGLVRDKHIVQPELVFDTHVSCSLDDLRAGQASAASREEHVQLVTVRNRPSSVVQFIQTHLTELTPVALASLLLHGLHGWGSGWFASTRGYLRSLI